MWQYENYFVNKFVNKKYFLFYIQLSGLAKMSKQNWNNNNNSNNRNYIRIEITFNLVDEYLGMSNFDFICILQFCYLALQQCDSRRIHIFTNNVIIFIVPSAHSFSMLEKNKIVSKENWLERKSRSCQIATT
jgi:hypothetical protein